MSDGNNGATVAVLTSLGLQAPLFLAWVAGIVVAAVTWRKHATLSLLVTIALAIMLVVGVGLGAIQAALPFVLIERGMGAQEVGVALSAVGGLRILLDTVAWALLLIALFRRRPEV